MNKRLSFGLFAAAVAQLLPISAFAVVASPGVTIAGYSYSIGGQIASTANISQLDADIVQIVDQAGSAVAGSISDQTQAQQQMLDSVVKQIAAIMARQSAYQAKADMEKTYGAPPATVCSDANAAASAPQGDSDRSAAKAATDQTVTDWMNSKSGQDLSVKTQATTKFTDQDLDTSMLTTSDLSSADIQRQTVLVQHMIDYRPPDPLPKNQLATPMGMVYQSVLNDRKMRLNTARDVLVGQVADTQPTYALGDWLLNILNFGGYSNTAEGKAIIAAAASNGNKISYNQMLTLMVDAKSPKSLNYLAQVQTMSQADLLREMVYQQSLSNLLALTRLKNEQKVAVMQASDTAMQVNSATRQQLDALRASSPTFSQ